MLGTDSNFGTVVDIKTLEQILKSFSHATGLRAVFCGSDGSLEVTPGSEFPEALFCQLVRNCPRGRSRCAKSYATAGREAAKWGEPYIFRCHAGLVGWAAPVLQEEEHVSTIICSQVLMWEPEDFFWDEIWEVTKDLGVESPELALAAKQLTVISPQRVKAAADLLFLTANYLTRKGSIILEQRRAIQDQQARLQELLEERKEKYLPIYSFKKERELLEKIRVGKKEQAERILDDILADELILFVKQPDLVKTRLQE
ncbi:MAG TPA: AraC family transcriptional regulator, partial [Firmicutes bacterium]|nr:AraC family transcriptional regulator [Bacillota bacterium]